jgi:hypothetical protein
MLEVTVEEFGSEGANTGSNTELGTEADGDAYDTGCAC